MCPSFSIGKAFTIVRSIPRRCPIALRRKRRTRVYLSNCCDRNPAMFTSYIRYLLIAIADEIDRTVINRLHKLGLNVLLTELKKDIPLLRPVAYCLLLTHDGHHSLLKWFGLFYATFFSHNFEYVIS